MKRLYPSVCLLAPLVLGACGKDDTPAEPARLVQTMAVSPAGGATVSTYPGQIVSRYEGRLGFRVAGTLIAKLVDVGDPVRAGQPLARLDPADAQLNANSAAAQTSASASAADQQRIDLSRARRLLGEGFISQAEFDRQKVAVDQAQAQLRSARSQQAAARHQVDYTVLRAERSGVVTAFDGDVGQVLPAGQPVATVATPGDPEASISVPEGDVTMFRKASLAVRIWSNPGMSYAGRIRTLSPAANAQTRTFDARVAIAAGGASAPLGSTAEVVASIPTLSTALRVPMSALTQRGGTPTLWIVTGTPARVAPRAVRIVEVQGNAVLVSGDLQAGERIVTAGVHLLHPGDVVRLGPGR